MTDQLWIGFCAGVLTCILLVLANRHFGRTRTSCFLLHRWSKWEPGMEYIDVSDGLPGVPVTRFQRTCERCGKPMTMLVKGHKLGGTR